MNRTLLHYNAIVGVMLTLSASSAFGKDDVIEIRGQAVGPYANLPKANLVAVRDKLRDRRLVGINLEGANMVSSKFNETDLTRGNLKGANLNSAGFGNARLVAANLSNTQMDNTYFIGAILERANLRGVRASHARFQKTNLRRADFSGATLKSVSFEGADLSYANMSEVRFELGAVFTDANLTGVEWGNTDLKGCFFGKQKCAPGSLNGVCK